MNKTSDIVDGLNELFAEYLNEALLIAYDVIQEHEVNDKQDVVDIWTSSVTRAVWTTAQLTMDGVESMPKGETSESVH